MGLPFIIDVAIGLIFIYLILSLLASELQELLTTLLQWRAKHLKEAIQVLLSGGTPTPEIQELVAELYDDPLLKNINQSATSGIAKGIRQVSSYLFAGNRIGAFGKRQASGPSYIAPETFATSLMERLGLSTLVEKLTEVRLEKFMTRIVGSYSQKPDGSIEIPSNDDESFTDNWKKGGIRLIASNEQIGKLLQDDPNFKALVIEYDNILEDFREGQSALETCVERMEEALSAYLVNQETDSIYFKRLESYKKGLFGKSGERAILAGGLRPSLVEIAELTDQTSKTCQELTKAFEKAILIDEKVTVGVEAQLKAKDKQLKDLTNEDRRLYINQVLRDLLDAGEANQQDLRAYESYQTYKEIAQLLNRLPASIRESLSVLARRAQTKVERTGNELSQFRHEVGIWFDRSMSRGSGVYKRNAKGVAIVIGVLLAVITNSDSVYIVDRLSNDDNLRRVVTEQAFNIAPAPGATPMSTEDLKALKNKTDAVLQELPFPVGWNSENVNQQFNRPLGIPRAIVGWLVSGIAIAMGAPFWFDLLGKVVNVRNSGGKPPSPASEKASTKD